MLKTQIIEKLAEKNFPDLKFFLQEEVLALASEVLEELLEKEKKEFYEFLEKKNETLVFDDLESESLLDFFWSILNHFENVESSEKLREIIENFMPKLQDFGNEVAYNKDYFEKIVFMRKNLELDFEQKKILDESIKAYKDRGIDLSEEKQEELKKINKRLGELSEKFGNNLVDSKKEFEYVITDFEVIKDLPKDVLELTKNAYKEKFAPEKEGYLFDSDPTSAGAIMKYCLDRKIRQDFEKASYTSASSGKFDNRPIILEMLQLKDKKAKILGFKNFAELSLNTKMADSPEQVKDLILGISEKAKQKANLEVEELKKYFSLDELESYDFAFYSRKLKEEKYDVDDKEVKKYFEYENVINYLHRFVEKFFGLEIKETSIESYHKDVKVYEIWKNEKLISYYFLDAFYRKGKRPGAWADSLRSKEYFTENEKVGNIGLHSLQEGIKKVPVILNVCNFLKAENGKTTLPMYEVETLFHEFGHAIHEMLSESKYSSLSGFNVEWDFVELPSQLLENWVSDKESLKLLGKHFETGEGFPEELLEKFEKLKTFMTGNFVARQNEFALLDMILYSSEIPETVEELDKKTLEIVNKYGFRKRSDDYKMYASFHHIFGGGYAAGYYSYMWAEILEADVFARIKEMGMFSPKTGEKLFKTIIGQGSRKPAKELFFDFMGREVDNKAFMERYGI